MVNWIEEYIKGLERTENTISSEEYINWLKNYTRTKFKISDTDYLYYSDTLDDNDREHLDLLRSLFDGIDKYAYKNELYPTLVILLGIDILFKVLQLAKAYSPIEVTV